MKKKLILLIPILLFCFYLVMVENDKSLSFKENEVLASGINSLLEKDNTEFVFVGNDNCISCQKYEAIVNKAIKKTKKTVYYMNTLNNKNKKFLKENNVNFTPTILVINNGRIKRIEGKLNYHETKDLFEEK